MICLEDKLPLRAPKVCTREEAGDLEHVGSLYVLVEAVTVGAATEELDAVLGCSNSRPFAEIATVTRSDLSSGWK